MFIILVYFINKPARVLVPICVSWCDEEELRHSCQWCCRGWGIAVSFRVLKVNIIFNTRLQHNYQF